LLQRPHLQRLDLRDERFLDPLPHGFGDVAPRYGRALLPLELKSAADHGRHQRLGVGRRMRHDEILAAGLSDDAGIVPVRGDVVAHRLPHVAEHGRGAREMDACQPRVLQHQFTDLRAGRQEQIDHAGGQSRFLQDAHDEVRGVHGRRSRLP
jgi:hypothetical protein